MGNAGSPSEGHAAVSYRSSDPWYARFLGQIFDNRHALAWITLWLVLILAAFVTVAVLTGPTIPAAVAACGTAVAGGAGVTRAVRRTRSKKSVSPPPGSP